MEIPAMTVTECLNALNDVLYTQVVVVEGEVNSYNVSQGKWVFFSLRDEESKIECFAVLYKISTPLEAGMKVRVVGVPGIHKRSGKFSLTINSLELIGEGDLQKAFELLKNKLDAEGLFSLERKRSIAKYPKQVALIASTTSAAYTDFLRILENRWSGLVIDVLDVSVQGEKAIDEIEAAFNYLNESVVQYDAVVLTRGGGSLEDLHAFNDERVARAVARSRFPVVCGIGHERDISISDFVADIRASTPSNAAEILAPDKLEEQKKLDFIRQNIFTLGQQKLNSEQHKIKYAIKSLVAAADAQRDLLFALQRRLAMFANKCEYEIIDHAKSVTVLINRVARTSRDKLIAQHRHLLNLKEKLGLQNPKQILGKGYSIVRGQHGVIKSVSSVAAGEPLQIMVSDGNIDAVVTD